MSGEYTDPYLFLAFGIFLLVGILTEIYLKIILSNRSVPASDPIVQQFNKKTRTIKSMALYIDNVYSICYRNHHLKMAVIKMSGMNFAPRSGPFMFWGTFRFIMVHCEDIQTLNIIENDWLFKLYADFPDVGIRLYSIKYLSIFVFKTKKFAECN